MGHSEEDSPCRACDHSREFLRSISVAITMTRSYEDSPSKKLLWMHMMSLIVDHEEYRTRCQRQGYLSYDLKLVCTSHGVAIMTTCERQVNVNLLVPVCVDAMRDLFDHTLKLLDDSWLGYSIDVRPLSSLIQIAPPGVRQRRFVPSHSYIRALHLTPDDTLTCEGCTHSIKHRILNVQEVCKYKPLARMDVADHKETEYWHRFPCGSIAVFTNPFVPLHPVLPLPPRLESGTRINDVLTPACREYARTLNPSCLEQCIVMMQATWVPLEMRRFCVPIAKANFGISDYLIITVARTFGEELQHSSSSGLLSEMYHVVLIIDEMRRGRYLLRLAMNLFDATRDFHDTLAWRKWMFTSEFTYALVDRLPCDQWLTLCRHTPIVYYITAYLLINKSKEWNQQRIKKAHTIISANIPPFGDLENDPIETIRRCMLEVNRFTDEVCESLLSENPTRVVHRKPSPVPHAPPLKLRETTVLLPTVEPLRIQTHESLVDEIARVSALCCTLIGSGVFFDRGDADLVVTYPADTLQNAYDAVLRRLTKRLPSSGWVQQCDVVSNDHVAVLQGTFRDVKIDIQVWRGGDVDTEAERTTQRALRLTRSLVNGVTDVHCHHVSLLHSFAQRSGWKGHTLCRLPGVAITCIAIVVGCMEKKTLHNLLDCVRNAIAQEVPVVDFDRHDVSSKPSRERPCVALSVIVDEQNIASRITVAMTRHFLDTLSYAIDSGVDSNVFDWRQRNMVRCLRIVPRESERSISMTLHTAVAKFDGHPLIDTVYVQQDEEDVGVSIYVTLSSAADVLRYGFRDTDLIHIEGDMARVTRGHRTWILYTVPVDQTNLSIRRPDEPSTSVTQLIHVDQLHCVPNAPYLTIDAMACFDSRHWEHVNL